MQSAMSDLKLWLRVLKSEEEGYLVNCLPSGSRHGSHKPFDRSADEIVIERRSYFRANTVGMRDIYARPYNMKYVMVDDISTFNLYRAYEYDPTLVVETSKDNHQVWYKCDGIENRTQQLNIARWFAYHLPNADKGATATMQLSRLPGFFNRKPGRNKFTVRIRKDRRYTPGQRSSIPDEAIDYTLVKTKSSSRKRSRSNEGRSNVSKKHDNSSKDFHFVMSELRKRNGNVSDLRLCEMLFDRTNKKNADTTDYVPKLVARARVVYYETHPFASAFR